MLLFQNSAASAFRKTSLEVRVMTSMRYMVCAERYEMFLKSSENTPGAHNVEIQMSPQ